MRSWQRCWLVVCLLTGSVLGPSRSAAQSFSVSGSPATLSITTAVAGSPPTSVTNMSTTYNVRNLVLTSKIRARLSAPLPAGVTLRLRLNAPPGGTSVGYVTLTTTDQVVVSTVPIGNFKNLVISYELSTTVAAGQVPLDSRVVTLTLSAL